MEIKVYVLGELATNCYLVICRDSKEAIVIDPGGDPAPVLDELEREGLKLRYIINTHGHMDHIEGEPIPAGSHRGPNFNPQGRCRYADLTGPKPVPFRRS